MILPPLSHIYINKSNPFCVLFVNYFATEAIQRNKSSPLATGEGRGKSWQKGNMHLAFPVGVLTNHIRQNEKPPHRVVFVLESEAEWDTRSL